MRLLLDTHVVLWVLTDATRLSDRARQHIADAEAVFVSAASIWELAIKAGIGCWWRRRSASRCGC